MRINTETFLRLSSAAGTAVRLIFAVSALFAVFVAATFGVGGVVGYRVSGGLYDVLKGHQLFAVASVMALLPAVVMALTPHPPRAPRAPAN